MSDTNNASSGVGFGSLLALLFIGLKLGGVITWSWWWVLSPIWISWALIIAVIGVIFVGALIFDS